MGIIACICAIVIIQLFCLYQEGKLKSFRLFGNEQKDAPAEGTSKIPEALFKLNDKVYLKAEWFIDDPNYSLYTAVEFMSREWVVAEVHISSDGRWFYQLGGFYPSVPEFYLSTTPDIGEFAIIDDMPAR